MFPVYLAIQAPIQGPCKTRMPIFFGACVVGNLGEQITANVDSVDMNYGFDMDGTIDAEPAAFQGLMDSLVHCGHEVHVITGRCMNSEDPEWKGTREGRVGRLAELGFTEREHFTHLDLILEDDFLAVAARKREICREQQIVLMFEDRQDFIDEITKISRCLLMVPRGGS